MVICHRGRYPAARGALQEAQLEQIGFVHVLYRFHFFADVGGDRRKTDGAAVIESDHRRQYLPIQVIKPFVVHAQNGQSFVGDFLRDQAIAIDLGEIAHTAEQPVGNTRGASGSQGDFDSA